MKKKNERNSRFRFYPSTAMMLAILLAGIVILANAYYWMSEYTIFFWLYQIILSLLMVRSGLCLLIPLAIALAYIDLKPPVSRWRILLIFGVLTITLFGSCTASTLTIFKDYQRNDDLYTESYSYHADSWWSVGVGNASKASYGVWWCDRLDILCKRIFAHREGAIYPEEIFINMPASLSLNSVTQEIEFRLDDRLLYSWRE